MEARVPPPERIEPPHTFRSFPRPWHRERNRPFLAGKDVVRRIYQLDEHLVLALKPAPNGAEKRAQAVSVGHRGNAISSDDLSGAKCV